MSAQPSTSASASSSSRPSNDLATYLSYAQLITHLFIVIGSFILFLPFVGTFFEFTTLQWLLIWILRCSMIALALTLVRKHTPVQMNMTYAQRLFMDEHSHFFLFAFLLYTTITTTYSPTSIVIPILILPFTMRSIIFICGASAQLLPRFAPTLAPKLQPYTAYIIQSVPSITRTNALLEVMGGFLAIFSLFTSHTTILQVIFIWQYLRGRYSLSADSRFAFQKVYQVIDSKLNLPFVPRPIYNGWSYLSNSLHSMSDPQAMAQRQQNLPSCNIM